MATTPPPAAPPEPLSLDEVRLNLRQPPVQQNDRLTALIVVAREYVEEETGLVLVPQLVTETARELGRWIELASWPVTDVTEIRYPVAGVMTALPDGSWQASYKRRPVRILPIAWGWGVASGFGARCYGPATLPVEIDVQAGYATPDEVPMRVKQAMHLLIAHWFTNREGVETGQRAAAIEVPLGVGDLLRRLRQVRV